MEIYSMLDIIGILGLPFPKHGESSYYIQCPCCDDPRDARSKHLNINLRKNVYRCPRCGLSGGMFDLYAYYENIPRKNVYNEIRKKMGKLQEPSGTPKKAIPIVSQPVEEIENPIIDVESRHATYSALLSKLNLSSDHRENLRNRGFTDKEIEKLEYKTTPVMGMSSIAKQLRSEGYYLEGVPGFFRKDDGEWTFINEKRGILIPVRDYKGQIQGLQIRRDNTEKRKFRWVSSSDMKDGCKAEGWTHLAGPISEKIILTEGPMKADVIHTLTGITVLAVPGVNTLTQLKLTLEILRKEGLKNVKTAFDMDLLTNYHVQNGFNNLLQLLDDMNFKFGTYIWDPRYKGLDDYIWESLMNKKR
ncbi:MAG: DUF3854 domain-containing protein [Clostridia bacterium]|nr:DUF3854 domain-containing protein [Clostridia bacterium]